MSTYRDRVRLVHITTVPQSLSFVSGQPRFLAARGFVVHAISSPGEAWEPFLRKERTATYEIAMERRITPLKDLIALWHLFWLLRILRPHIVHTHTPKAGLLGMLAAWLAGVPIRLHTIHGLPIMTARGLKRLLLRATDWTTCRCASLVLAVSFSIRAAAIWMRLCPARKIRVLLSGSVNGVDAKRRFNPAHWDAADRASLRRRHGIPQDAQVIGFVGRIVRDKGMVELAEAWRKLRGRFPNLHLLLVGPFEPQDPIPADVEELFHADPRIHLAGSVRNVVPYYAMMDILALPTYREGLPGVLLEASAMQLPSVATRIPGCIDAVVDGTTSTLVPPYDAEALASALSDYLIDPALRRLHGQAGRRWVRREFQRKAIWKTLHKLYLRLLRRQGVPIPDVRLKPKKPALQVHSSGRRAA